MCCKPNQCRHMRKKGNKEGKKIWNNVLALSFNCWKLSLHSLDLLFRFHADVMLRDRGPLGVVMLQYQCVSFVFLNPVKPFQKAHVVPLQSPELDPEHKKTH